MEGRVMTEWEAMNAAVNLDLLDPVVKEISMSASQVGVNPFIVFNCFAAS